MSQHQIDFSHRFSVDGLLTQDDLLDTICLMSSRAIDMLSLISMLCDPKVIAALDSVQNEIADIKAIADVMQKHNSSKK